MMRLRWLSVLAGFIASLALGACSAPAPQPAADGAVAIDASDPPDMADPVVPEPARYLLLRSVRWPGGGRELTLGVLNDKTGRPFEEDLSARIGVLQQGGFVVTVAASRRVPAPGYTALLLPPTQSLDERVALAKAVQDFAAARPAERIALYRHGAAVQLFSGYLRDQSELGEALLRYQDGTDDDAPLPLEQAIEAAAAELHQVGGEGPDVMRALIVLTSDAGALSKGSSEVLLVGAAPDAAGLAGAGATIDDVRAQAFYRVAVCSRPERFDGALRVLDLAGTLTTSFPATLPEEVNATCDLAAIDSAQRTFTPRIELVFDDAQRAAYEERVRATQKPTFNEALAKSDFETQLRLAPGQPVILATAHLRGNSSLSCERKGLTVKLSGPARYLLPDSASDEYHLISMCDDRAYTYAPTAYTLFADDLFPLQRRFVELVIDGTTRGIYLLMEKAREELVRDHARATAVMRRGYPVNGREFFEVEYPTTGDLTAPLTRYAAFEDRLAGLTGDELYAALREGLDLDQYLRWLASQSILQSGDYVDEAYFVSTEQADGKGQVGEVYRVMPWDAEGYTTCHAGGVNAYVDPNLLAYCSEARLDHRLLANPRAYALFVAKIEEQLAGPLAPDRVAAALNQTRTQLQALLVDPAICAAMIELKTIDPRAADCAVARNVVGARADALRAAYDARRGLLINRLAAYHLNNP